MKKIVASLVLVLCGATAESKTKVQKIELDDENITIIRADVDADQTYYHMDTKACLCWLSVYPDISNPLAVSTFDCRHLGVFKKFSKAVEACAPKPAPTPEPAQAKVEVPETTELKVEQVGAPGPTTGPSPASVE